MKITRVSTLLLSATLPQERRWRSDLGTMVKADIALVQVETDEGISGLGAAQGSPEVIKAMVEDELQPLLLGEDPTWTERLWAKMYNGSRFEPSLARGYSLQGHGRRGDMMAAIAGVDIALWDIFGKVLGQPIYKLLGAARDRIRGYASGGWAPGEQAGEEIAGYIAKGFTAAKMRAEGMDGFSIPKSIRRIAAARKAIGPEVELFVDAHGSLNPSTAIRLAKRMEEYDVGWFEEPVSPDYHSGMAEVRAATSVPIATGERETTRFEFRDLLEKRAVDIIQPDIAISGGFTETRRIAAMASAYGVRFAPHVWGSGVLFAASIHIALSAPNCHIFEVSQARYGPLVYEIFTEPFDIREGHVYAPKGPGLGFELRPDVEKRFAYVPGPAYVYTSA
ncbi:MAG: mandelate racemase/muconate lactonizing enzyme family protein [Chloroflexi bacterium]|nr:mandelate racemase/muconate lactonizing enzyme family protein [Chloroflexota bacterium]